MPESSASGPRRAATGDSPAAVLGCRICLAISTGWVVPIFTVALFVVLELFSNNNIVEAWLYGKKTGMSAVAVLLAAVFWRWLWGVAGLLLATPLFASVRTTERMSRRRWRRHKNRSAC